MSPLPESAARCLDTGCPERANCARFQSHRDGIAFPSLFPFDAPLDSLCPLRVPLDDNAAV